MAAIPALAGAKRAKLPKVLSVGEETMYIPHPHRPGCGYTVLIDEQLTLFKLGLMPVRCKSCRELLTDCEGA